MNREARALGLAELRRLRECQRTGVFDPAPDAEPLAEVIPIRPATHPSQQPTGQHWLDRHDQNKEDRR